MVRTGLKFLCVQSLCVHMQHASLSTSLIQNRKINNTCINLTIKTWFIVITKFCIYSAQKFKGTLHFSHIPQSPTLTHILRQPIEDLQHKLLKRSYAPLRYNLAPREGINIQISKAFANRCFNPYHAVRDCDRPWNIYLCQLEATAVAKKTAFKFPAVVDHCLLMNINELCADSLCINNNGVYGYWD